MRLALLLALLVVAPAAAHGPEPVRPDALWRTWNLDLIVVGPLLIASWLYGRGVLRLWRRAGWGRGIHFAHATAFLAGSFAVVLALVSPLDRLAGTLLSAHMAQHALLVAVAPPLLLLGRPGPALAWGLPGGIAKSFGPARVFRFLAGALARASRPGIAALLHGLVLWLWHIPFLFDAAIGREWLHILEHATFFGTALLFWRSLFLAFERKLAVGGALSAAFATLMHGGFMGALITFAPQPLYTSYQERPLLWGMSALEDQQFAGLLMWVPMGFVYLAACLAITATLLTLASADARGNPYRSIAKPSPDPSRS